MFNSSDAAQALPDKARFLIHAEHGAPLNDFLAIAAIDPDITVLDVIGPPDRPHTAVVELSPGKARLLDEHFRQSATPSHQLSIEPDRPLSMFDSGPFNEL
ncbi:hypothetical protein SAMN05192549_1045 [Duganella sacchari]|uniref:Uncharacterized protein n=1 Tax=Duganella sacchari TaxID=551987 RepID=A0A1M7NJ78_9BURK|nr:MULTISPECIES: hypothetical protein [Duganella]MYM27453.1 hypothetical protein [Duganella sp. CY15W]SHN03889.1 hypothetical protein SAMN05192549_1045 [Duganella sacchari]